MKHIFTQAIAFLISLNIIYAATESREWNTTSGHKVEAVALSVANGKVSLKKSNGRVVKVNISLLVAEDQTFLKDHFKVSEETVESDGAEVEGSGVASAEGLPHPVGKLSGPIEANGSTYLVYVPKTLKQGRKASLLFYTHSVGGGNGKLINDLADAAETLGWVMAISIESKNGNPKSSAHAMNCITHILHTLPVDEERIHYSGNSGGAAQAFVNTANRRAFGVMPNVGYAPRSIKEKTKVVYALGGGQDFNRYLSAYIASKYKKNGFHRMSPKGHGPGPAEHYMDGMIWMHCKYLKMGEASADEKADFEASIIKWMNDLKDSNPKRAYHTACVVRDVYEISGENAKRNDAIISELAKDNANVLYYEGLLDIDELSDKVLADLGKDGNSKMKHFSKKAARAAEKLKEKYGAVQEIIDVLDAIMKKTV